MKPILKSDSAFIAIGNSPSWTTGTDSGRLLSLVQSSSYSVNIERQTAKSVGNDSLFVHDVSRAPSVEVQIEYNLSPFLNNEHLFGMKGSFLPTIYSSALATMASQNNSIYLLIDDQDGDGFRRPKALSTNFSGFSAVACGNCFLKSYGVNWSVGQIPKVSTSFDSSNIEFHRISGAFIPIPAINLVSGNQLQRGTFRVDQLTGTLPSGFIATNLENRTEYNASTALPSSSVFTLQNLQCGGVNILNSAVAILQSFDLGFEVPRIPMYGLGSNHVFDRKMALPAMGTVSVSALVSGSGILSGEFNTLTTGETSYSFEVAFSDIKKYSTGFFKIENAKLSSISMSMGVNDTLGFSASFSFPMSLASGLQIKREIRTS